MKKNMGTTDRIIRLLIVVVIAVLYYFKVIEGTAGNVLLALAGIFFVTGLIGFCPAYSAFGIRTCLPKKIHSAKE
jgi:Inner membrane protein YgaP-like, transmembrane domain